MVGNVALAAYTTNSSSTTSTTITDELGQGFGGRREMMGGNMGAMMGRFGTNVEVSSAYNATVMSILQEDTDVQNLLTQGYSVSAVRPIIKTVVEGDGSVVNKASSAIVTLQNSSTSRATVWVDVEAGKVTKIVTVTVTVIEK
jgi:hypothetical protein